VADDAADDSTTDGSDRAAAGQDCTSDSTDTGANGRVLIPCRQAGTAGQAEQRCRGKRAERDSMHRSH
jgi:hypothetical protein